MFIAGFSLFDEFVGLLMFPRSHDVVTVATIHPPEAVVCCTEFI